ncbi:MAG TPA: DJ-1/PfpI family protein [Chthoniobacterales bacterium]|nr:DJ-1/PfpI family protein [Chthoniobacterales bacterium]
MKRIGILVFDDVEELDFVGPLEVFGVASDLGADCAITVISEKLEPVDCYHGLRVLPDQALDRAGELDVLIVPGGAGARLSAAKNPRILGFIQKQGGLVASVCTGAFVLAAAGVLKNMPATTHHAFLDQLAKFEIQPRPGERFVINERIATAGGVTAGIDLALALVARFWGEDLASRVADNLEWQS